MIPYAFKIGTKKLREFALLIGAIMVLTNAVYCEGSCEGYGPVKSIFVYNKNSNGYVGVTRTNKRGDPYELVSNFTKSKNMFTIKLSNEKIDFLLFDPQLKRYICVKADKKKIVTKATLPKDVSRCTWEEVADINIQPYLQYVNRSSNLTMAFNKKGHQLFNKKLMHKHLQSSFMLLSNHPKMPCHRASEHFCKMNQRKRHKRILEHICKKK